MSYLVLIHPFDLLGSKQMYKQEAGHCAECRAFWEKLADEKATHVAKLEDLIRRHIS
jgi:hypothetical protein